MIWNDGLHIREVTCSGLYLLSYKEEMWRREVLGTLWVPRLGRQFNTAWATPGFFSFPSLNNRTGIREGTCRHTCEFGWTGTPKWNKGLYWSSVSEQSGAFLVLLSTVLLLSQVSQLRNEPGASKGVLTCWESPGDGAQASKIFLKRENVLGRVDDTSCIYHLNS